MGEPVAAPQPEESLPWQQMEGESGKAYEAFCVFRDQGATRSCSRVARHLGKSGQLIRRWSATYDWQARSAAWDRHLEAVRDQAWVKAQTAHPDEIAAMNARHAEAAVAVQQKALLRLASISPDDLSPAQTLAWLVEAVKLERMARGEAKEDDAAGDEADQDAVVRLLADPESRRLASQLAARAGHAARNGHGSG